MLKWPVWQRAAIFCTPALAIGLFMDSFPGRAAATAIFGLFFLGMVLMAGAHAVELLIRRKNLSDTSPILIYVAIFTAYGVLSASIGHWYVDYRFSRLCEWFQAEIRKLPAHTSPESLTALSRGHRLIFIQPTVTAFRDERSGITILIEDPREFLSPEFHVSAHEIRYIDPW